MARTLLKDFALANAAYDGCRIYVWVADASGNATSTLATLYADLIGTEALTNPQRLDNTGKLRQATYHDVDVVVTIDGLSHGTHQTGVIKATISAEDVTAAIAASNLIIGLYDEIVRAAGRAAGARTAADEAAAAAAASAVQIIGLFEVVQRRIAGQSLLRSQNLSDVLDPDAAAANLGLSPVADRLYFSQHFV